MTVQFADFVCDRGLAAFAEADAVYLCYQRPATFQDATSTYALGLKLGSPGTLFSEPLENIDEQEGRAVVSFPITEGTVIATGSAVRWAAVDRTNSRLLASGTLVNPFDVKAGQQFSLSPWVIALKGDLLPPFEFFNVPTFIRDLIVIGKPALTRRLGLTAATLQLPNRVFSPAVITIPKKIFNAGGLTVSTKTIGAPSITQTAPVVIGDPEAIFAASPALNLNDPSNLFTTFRVVVPITEDALEQIRVTLKPGLTGLSILGLGVGEYVEDGFGSTSAPVIEGTFSGQRGFTNATAPKTSDWIDVSALDLQAGDKLVVSFTTGNVVGSASLSYDDTQSGVVTYWHVQDYWGTQDVSTLGFNERIGYNFGVSLVETRDYNYFPATFDSTLYSFDSTKISFDSFAGPDVVGLIASSFTESGPDFTAPSAAQPTFVVVPIVPGAPRVSDSFAGSLIGAAPLVKASMSLGAPALVQFHYDIYPVSLENKSPAVGPAAPAGVVVAAFTRAALTVGAPTITSLVTPTAFPSSITRAATTIGAPTLSSSGTSPDSFADGQTAPVGFHWEYVTDDSDGSQITENGQPVVELVAN